MARQDRGRERFPGPSRIGGPFLSLAARQLGRRRNSAGNTAVKADEGTVVRPHTLGWAPAVLAVEAPQSVHEASVLGARGEAVGQF